MQHTEIPESVLREIEEERLAAPHGTTRALLMERAVTLGVSLDKLYADLRRYRGRTKTVARPVRYGQAIIDEIALRKAEALQMGEKEREIPTHILRQELIDEGIPEDLVPSESAINTRLRRAGFRLRRERRLVEAGFANQHCELDFSRLKYFQLKAWDEARQDWLLVVHGRELSYKEDNKKLRTWIVNYKDSYSRLFLPRVYAASGESLLIGIEHLYYVWNRPADEHPLRYLPTMLQTDRGALAKSKAYQEMCRALGVEVIQAQSKEAQGKIENSFKQLWRSWELPLAHRMGMGATILLGELNELLQEWALQEARRLPYPRNRRLTREQAYQASLRMYPPRQVEEDVRRLACEVVYRVVDEFGKVSVDNAEFKVPTYVGGADKIPTMGKRIRIKYNGDGEYVGELVERYAKPFKLTPWAPNELGDYSRAPGTYRDQVEAQARRRTAERKAEAKAAAAPPPGPIRTLPPRPVTVTPDSAILLAGAPEALAPHEARVYAARKLEPHGLRLLDWSDVFDPLFEGAAPITREAVDTLVAAVLAHIRKAI